MEQALKPEAQGDVAVEPVADLIARLTYRVNNPSAWDSFDDGASELIREAASSIASLSERLAEVTAQSDRFCDKYLAALKRAEAAEAKLVRYENWQTMDVTPESLHLRPHHTLLHFYMPGSDEYPDTWLTTTWDERPENAEAWCLIVTPLGPDQAFFERARAFRDATSEGNANDA